jgi:hypothetical protein
MLSQHLQHLAPPLQHLCTTLLKTPGNKGFAPLHHLHHPLIGVGGAGGAPFPCNTSKLIKPTHGQASRPNIGLYGSPPDPYGLRGALSATYRASQIF